MATNTDIRHWARANGIPLHSEKGPVRKTVREMYEAAVAGGDVADGEVVEHLALVQAPDSAGEDPGPVGPDSSTEQPPRYDQNETRAPQPPKRGLLGRLRRGRRRSGRPGRAGRASTEKLVSIAWSGLAKAAGAAHQVPLQRTLAMQAPVAGALLDRELHGTRIDKALQPLARMVNRGSRVGALLGMPVLVQAATMRPELFPLLRPMLVECIFQFAEIAGPEMERQQQRQKKRAEQLDIDPDAILDMLFGPLQPPADDDVAA
jgi:hypothetical protein